MLRRAFCAGHGGELNAISTGLDRAVPEHRMSRARPLAADARHAAGVLQQLWRAAAQRAPASRFPPAYAPAPAQHLPPIVAASLTRTRITSASGCVVAGVFQHKTAGSSERRNGKLAKKRAADWGPAAVAWVVVPNRSSPACSSACVPASILPAFWRCARNLSIDRK